MVHTICWKVEKRPNLTKDSTAIFQKHWPHCDVLQRCRNLRVRGNAMVPQSPISIYSCSIGHILEHEICQLGWKEKISETTEFLLR